ncbi:hypothetical protein [Streptomyces halobius]|uniref:Uncharacterized protein n=1 Tax=Streptomyces halobius TaxID=2879846 RepID=A0ABY4M352_9ACTN|nr:hypothetical protein [Streptomyces halobius]UQA91638.1 hypothetical protein K9S39_06985 [Streptomyces halobius]
MALAKKSEEPPDWLKPYIEAIQGEGGGGGGARSRYAGPVYMGRIKQPSAPHLGSGQVAPLRSGNRWVDGEDAEVEYNNWNEKKRKDFIAQAKIAGLIPADGGEVEGGRIWRELVKEASYFGKNKKNKVSPWDILSGYVKSKGGPGAAWQPDPSNPDFEVNALTGERRYIGPRFKTTTQKTVDFSDPATAAAVATRAFQDLMGRDPGKGELARFADALHAAEAKSPIMTTTTTEYDPTTGEALGQTSTSEGGFDAAAKGFLAEQRVKGTEEYGVVQAATTYQNALENAIWGAPELGE